LIHGKRLYFYFETRSEIDLAECGLDKYPDDPSTKIVHLVCCRHQPLRVLDIARIDQQTAPVDDLVQPSELRFALR